MSPIAPFELSVAWPIAPRPFYEEAFGSWLGRVACRYAISVDMLFQQSGLGDLPALTNASWILFPPLEPTRLDGLAQLARITDDRPYHMQTPAEWMVWRKHLLYCHACLALNHADVFAPVWQREWLDPNVDYCRAHRKALDRVPTSVFAKTPNMAMAIKAVYKVRAKRRKSHYMESINCNGSR
jgi:hypothetical protein